MTALDGRRPRDRDTGFLKRRPCELYIAGHTVHYIQANRSAREPGRSGRIEEVDGNVFRVDFGDEMKDYRNHDVQRLLEIVDAGEVRVNEQFVILRGAGGHCFSITPAERPWVPCDTTPLTSFTPEALAERLRTHGGFLVPARAVVDALDDQRA